MTSGRSPFTRLVYPVPEAAGLGVHATIDLTGQTRFGPDVEWVQDPSDLRVDPGRAEKFYAEVARYDIGLCTVWALRVTYAWQIRKYWPGLRDNSLLPDYAGIRPKLQVLTSLTSM